MKSSLWIIIALVTGIVGFLMGYSVSAFTGSRRAEEIAAHGAPRPHDAAPAAAGAPAAQRPDAGGYAGAGGTAHDAKAGGYGGAGGTPHDAKAGGYGGAEAPRQPAVPAAQKVPADKPKAAGY